MHGKKDDERPFAVLHDSVTPQFPPCGLLFEDGFEIIVPWEVTTIRMGKENLTQDGNQLGE
jgi:hypothetical protein